MSDGKSLAHAPCVVTVAEFDFQNKLERSCTFDEASAAMEAGRFAWIDIDASDPEEARRLLESLRVIDQATIESALKNEPSTQHARFEEYIHLVVSG
jgi:Mg2+ and Co2+ transporter CorA